MTKNGTIIGGIKVIAGNDRMFTGLSLSDLGDAPARNEAYVRTVLPVG